MYAFLDRPIADLPAHDRLILDAVRAWALAHTLGRDPALTLAARLPELAETGAAEAIDQAMTALDQGSEAPLTIQRPCHDAVEEDEAMLLAIAALARADRLPDAQASLALVVKNDAARRITLALAEACRRSGAMPAWR